MEGWARSLGRAPAYTRAPQPLSTIRERGKLQKRFHWNPRVFPPLASPGPTQTSRSCSAVPCAPPGDPSICLGVWGGGVGLSVPGTLPGPAVVSHVTLGAQSLSSSVKWLVKSFQISQKILKQYRLPF